MTPNNGSGRQDGEPCPIAKVSTVCQLWEENFQCVLKGHSKIISDIKFGSLKTKQRSYKNSL